MAEDSEISPTSPQKRARLSSDEGLTPEVEVGGFQKVPHTIWNGTGAIDVGTPTPPYDDSWSNYDCTPGSTDDHSLLNGFHHTNGFGDHGNDFDYTNGWAHDDSDHPDPDLSQHDLEGHHELADLSGDPSLNCLLGETGGEGQSTENQADSDAESASSVSSASTGDWQATSISGPMQWVQHQMTMGINPRTILQELLPPSMVLPSDLDSLTLWKLVVNILTEPPKREKLPSVNTLQDVVRLIHGSKNIVVLTGAGVSVSCGIPDFRSRDGIYAKLAVDFPDLPDPQAMFDIDYFRKNPRPFFKFAKAIYPGQYTPSRCHRFIRQLEEQGKLLRNYTQNIDTLEQEAGIQRIIQCHGSFATASCTNCKRKVDCEEIRQDIFDQVVPRCPQCSPDGPMAVMKPDIVFFGEGLSDKFHQTISVDKDKVDLLIVIGSRLKVRPVALIPSSIPAEVPQVLINREPLNHMTFDVELLGDSDVIVEEICRLLGEGWTTDSDSGTPLNQVSEIPPKKVAPEGSCTPNCTQGSLSNMHSPNLSTTKEPTEANVNQRIDCLPANQEQPKSSPANQDAEVSANQDAEVSANQDAGVSANQDAEVSSTSQEQTSPELSRTGDQASSPSSKGDEFDRDPESEHDMEALRRCWQSKRQPKESVAKRLPDHSYQFVPPNRYVFQGAEVFSDSESDNDSDSLSDYEHERGDSGTAGIQCSGGSDEDTQQTFISNTSWFDGSEDSQERGSGEGNMTTVEQGSRKSTTENVTDKGGGDKVSESL
ncbi:PREDICTED: NAD-dependent protein deacetylase sirtuin-1-like [Branchiostoma belcheri]|uniref:protein acetyllysine N-acetyltransferase n=1 Tax=Branchiostoma belcheri TaxID=7741 RepID=A0A6P5AEF8_BRABE|nr:PREDICTED: NAD-dependent protein deacetylase sirtuin-1-like [Branchiostoma belcheri]